MPPLVRRRAVTRVGAAVVTGALVLAGCASTIVGHGTAVITDNSGHRTTSAAPPPPQPRAAFTDCTGSFNLSSLNFPAGRRGELSLTCARISVPADYSDPLGKTLSVQLVKVHDSRNTSGLALLVNPGGPGASGVDLAVGLAALERGLQDACRTARLDAAEVS